MTMQKQGFTLIEILIAIALVAIMMGVAGPAFLKYLERGRVRAAQAQLRSLKTSIEQYYADIGQFPEALNELIKGPSNEELRSRWINAYLDGKDVPVDPWGQKYHYKVNTEGEEHPYELYSTGPKGRSGGKESKIDVWKL